MNTAANSTEPRFLNVEVTYDEIIAFLRGRRTISKPLVWSWRRLSEATPEQRQHFTILGDGQGLHWPDIDEDQHRRYAVWRSDLP
ncbi:MAG: DUF2442 domain-containing protein [Pyrinomonadaceae bacterium]